MRRFFFAAIAIVVATPLIADDFVGLDQVFLKSGGVIFGKATERKVDGRKILEIQTESGSTIKLNYSSSIKKVRYFGAEQKEYLSRKEASPDTIDGHWEMAEWANKNLKSSAVNGLARKCPERDYHLKQILKLDPDDKKARTALGFRNKGGKWVHLEQMAVGHGLIRHKNKWITSHELEIIQYEEASDRVFKEWVRRLKKMPLNELKKLTDPTAVGPIIKLYRSKKSVQDRLLCANTLAQIKTPPAAFALADWAVSDPDRIVRERCLVHLKEDYVDTSAIGRHIIERYLSTNDSNTLNQAAFILGELKVEEAIVPLIKKLTTVNIVANPNFKGAGNIGASFGGGGSSSGQGLQSGSSQPSHFKIPVKNAGVLRALENITGTGFEYHKSRWMDWYMESKTVYDVDLRRDK